MGSLAEMDIREKYALALLTRVVFDPKGDELYWIAEIGVDFFLMNSFPKSISIPIEFHVITVRQAM